MDGTQFSTFLSIYRMVGNLELHNIPKLLLNFKDFELQYSYKLYSCKNRVHYELDR